jgi:ATP-binding cassette subfamily B protein
MFFGRGLLTVIEIVIMFVAVCYIMIALNWQLALLTLVFIPVIGWRAIRAHNLLEPIWLRIQTLMGVLSNTLQENLTGIKVVKAFSRQKEEIQKFSGQATTLYDEHIHGARVRAFNMPLMGFLISIPSALILWFGGRQVIAGTLTIGGLTQFILYLGMLAMPIRRLGMMIGLFSRTVAAGRRIFEILDTESQVKEKPNAIVLDGVKGEVTFEDVSFSYDSTVPALQNIKFNVKPGGLVALLGGSGCGKSTISNLLCRFYDVDSGRITIDGVDIRDVTLASLRKNVVAAQQDIFIFSDTIQNNIAYGVADADEEKILDVAKAAHIDDFVKNLADGYDTMVGERGLTLSGGERQRLAIARTLLIDPSVLILDDSTSSVDAETEYLIRKGLDELIKGRTTFIITHRLPIIKNADLILMLKDGKIVEQGKHDELMAMNGLYKQTYESQLSATEDSG